MSSRWRFAETRPARRDPYSSCPRSKVQSRPARNRSTSASLNHAPASVRVNWSWSRKNVAVYSQVVGSALASASSIEIDGLELGKRNHAQKEEPAVLRECTLWRVHIHRVEGDIAAQCLVEPQGWIGFLRYSVKLRRLYIICGVDFVDPIACCRSSMVFLRSDFSKSFMDMRLASAMIFSTRAIAGRFSSFSAGHAWSWTSPDAHTELQAM